MSVGAGGARARSDNGEATTKGECVQVRCLCLVSISACLVAVLSYTRCVVVGCFYQRRRCLNPHFCEARLMKCVSRISGNVYSELVGRVKFSLRDMFY